jgi:hypothetical protein
LRPGVGAAIFLPTRGKFVRSILSLVTLLAIFGLGAMVWRGKFLVIHFPPELRLMFGEDEPTDELRAEADAGDVDAQFKYGVLLASEAGGAPGAHFEYLLKAAESGHAGAENEIGNAYLRGLWGVRKDARAAIFWLERSASKGDEVAQGSLAMLFRDGDFVERSDARAAELFLASARKGYAASQFNYYLLVREGVGAPRNEIIAWRARRAAARGKYDADRFIFDSFQSADGSKFEGHRAVAFPFVGKSINPAQALRCGALFGDLSEIYESVPQQEVDIGVLPEGIDTVDDLIEIARDVERRQSKVVEPAAARAALLSVAAKLGDPIAQRRLAAAYSAGDGVGISESKANYWRVRADRNPLKDRFSENCEKFREVIRRSSD